MATSARPIAPRPVRVSELPTHLALLLHGEAFALEPGRSYVLGAAGTCDLRLGADAAPRHARLDVAAAGILLTDLGSATGTWRNGDRVATPTALAAGDALRFGASDAQLVVDDGSARIVPIPELRLAARERRYAAVRVAAVEALRGQPSLREQVLDELRHAPWFAVSLVAHLLLLLALWLLVPDRQPAGSLSAELRFTLAEGTAAAGDAAPTPPDVTVEPVDSEPDAAEEPTPPTVVRPAPRRAELQANPRVVVRRSGGTAGRERDPVRDVGSPAFQSRIADLRRSGLEIVFVLDSTGSMTRTITAAKNSITEMLTVLRTLVPDARVGLVAYRDHTTRETYDVRTLPLGRDFCRASNFVSVVTADGGGDRAEDVRGGLRAAFAQDWRPDARRVVVLAGDAPPHARDLEQLHREVGAFARDGRSFVHALVVSPDLAGADTHAAFGAIAADGHGQCLDLDEHERVLTDVLQLAIGREFAADLGAVVAVARQADACADTASLDLARRGGPDLTAALRADPVPLPLLAALARMPRRDPTIDLVDLLGDAATPAHTCHAIAWVLQRTLHLPMPPVDPLRGERPDQPTLDGLRKLARRLPN